ncbi:hypothetical protein I8J29_21575 [Paenibacillus sp. MWE-103]|uniref:Uncharacterized protein n=1 Tax=Paenibacillus artemisiicola TaxID=1172618 RepID=A0ABS3WEQ0_9BACL|nr:hypothetical protein [Paenibacillus artemisiicola]MBO7746810.1 hypothetical protein [Paenibacillus artemisiicola]
MTKADTMDKRLAALDAVTGAAVFAIVEELYGLDLASATASPDAPRLGEAIDACLADNAGRPAGSALRAAINAACGVNLDALSALEGKRISLYSKGRWMLRADDDLFVVQTGDGDADVAIYPTGRYADIAGTRALPPELTEALVRLGYAVNGPAGCSYADPAGEAVPDAFKGRTMAALLDVIRRSFADV